MQYLKKEINKLLPLALLCGAIGGVLLIVVGNVLGGEKWLYMLTYALVIAPSVFILNRIRFRKEIVGSVLYGYLVFAFMTVIAYFDKIMNADPTFNTPIFEQAGFLLGIASSVFLITFPIALLFKRKIIA